MHGIGTEIEQTFFPPVELGADDDDGEYLIGVLSLYTYNTFSNISPERGNNMFKFVELAEPIVFESGVYDVGGIFSHIESHLDSIKGKLKAGMWHDVTPGVKVSPDDFYLQWKLVNTTNRIVIVSGLTVDFNYKHSMAKIFGFNPESVLTPHAKNTAPNPGEIDAYKSVNLTCNIARGSYVNNKLSSVVLSFVPDVDPNFKIIHSPSPVLYYALNTRKIHQLSFRLEDEQGNLLDNRGEPVTIVLHIVKR